MKDFHSQIRFQCFVFLKEQSLSAGQKIHNTHFPLSPHLFLLVHLGKRYERFLFFFVHSQRPSSRSGRAGVFNPFLGRGTGATQVPPRHHYKKVNFSLPCL